MNCGSGLIVIFHSTKVGEKKTEDNQVDMLAAAYLVGEGRTQVEIARILEVTTAAVSRMVAIARGEYLHEETRFLSERVAPALMEKVRNRASKSELAERLQRIAIRNNQVRAPVLRVFNCDAPVNNVRERMNELGNRAAPYVRDLILRLSFLPSRNPHTCSASPQSAFPAAICGLTWGGMLRSLVLGLRALNKPAPWWKKGATPVECVPLSGEPLGNDPTNFSSSSLAHDLGVIINGEQYNALSLGMVPAFIPEGFTKQELQGIRKLIGLVRSYDQIFGQRDTRCPEESMADRIEMILTSVGPAERPLGFGQGRLFETGKITLEELQKLVIGDVGGVCLARSDLNRTDQQKLDSINERWTGLRESHLRNCARRALRVPDVETGPPGVVVISGGRARAQFIYEIVKRGLVNHLIIDDQLENELVSITV